MLDREEQVAVCEDLLGVKEKVDGRKRRIRIKAKLGKRIVVRIIVIVRGGKGRGRRRASIVVEKINEIVQKIEI